MTELFRRLIRACAVVWTGEDPKTKVASQWYIDAMRRYGKEREAFQQELDGYKRAVADIRARLNDL